MPTAHPHAATTLDLLSRAEEALTSGYATSSASARYLGASLAALRAAAAVVAAHPARSGGPGPHDVWALTVRAAPELGEWAERFTAATGRRVGVETGLVRVGAREADDLLRDAEAFLDLAARHLGVPVGHPPRRLAPVRSA